jgi:hypothetical protein
LNNDSPENDRPERNRGGISPFVIAIEWLAGYRKKLRKNIHDRQFFSLTSETIFSTLTPFYASVT